MQSLKLYIELQAGHTTKRSNDGHLKPIIFCADFSVFGQSNSKVDMLVVRVINCKKHGKNAKITAIAAFEIPKLNCHTVMNTINTRRGDCVNLSSGLSKLGFSLAAQPGLKLCSASYEKKHQLV